MRKALFVAYRFPPQGGGGVQRTLKFVKYLRDFGWEPVVHTALNPYWSSWDETLVDEIPRGVRVYRTRAFEFERLEGRLRALLGRPSRGRRPAVGEAHAGGGARPGWLRSVHTAVHRRVLVPDPQVAWVPGAFVHALVIARRERPQILYTSSPPNSVQLLGAVLAAALRRPWVADFRDPWTDGIRRQVAYAGNRTRAAVERAAERAVVRRADRVVVTTEAQRMRFLGKYPFLASEKVVVLTNGFDPADFAAAADGERLLEPGRFHITVAGNIEAMFDARPLLRAMAELVAEEAALRADLRLVLVGTKAGKYDADIGMLGLEDRVRYTGYVPHAESLRYLHQSDVLLLCQIPEHGSAAVKLSGKLFEYLYLRKPVLALTIPGVTTDLLAAAGLGTVVHPADVRGIKAAIRALYERRGEGARADTTIIARFDRRRLTERLVAIFDELTEPPSRRMAAA